MLRAYVAIADDLACRLGAFRGVLRPALDVRLGAFVIEDLGIDVRRLVGADRVQVDEAGPVVDTLLDVDAGDREPNELRDDGYQESVVVLALAIQRPL